MQTTAVLRLCIERSKAHHLCIVLLLGETDRFSDFLKTLTPHAPRWREFYFESDEYIECLVLQSPKLWNACHGLDLPQLRKLTLSRPPQP